MKRICVLGVDRYLYTQMMAKELLNHGIIITDLLLIKQRKRKYDNRFSKMINLCVRILKLINGSGPLETLSPFSIFFWKKLIKSHFFHFSDRYKRIIAPYSHDSFDELIQSCAKVTFKNDINNVSTYLHLKENQYDIGIFAGVGIVSKPIIDCFSMFCLNAHPAPLPKCRGGGALENTLNHKLHPASTVHIATEEIDAGDIFSIKRVELKNNDTWESVRLKCDVCCCQNMAEVVRLIIDGNVPERIPNNGPLHYWSQCNISVQRNAEKQLRHLISQL